MDNQTEGLTNKPTGGLKSRNTELHLQLKIEENPIHDVCGTCWNVVVEYPMHARANHVLPQKSTVKIGGKTTFH